MRKCTKGYTTKQVSVLAHKLGLPGGTSESVVAAAIISHFAITEDERSKLTAKGKRYVLKKYFAENQLIVGVTPYKKKEAITDRDGFYESREWRELRYKALVKHGPVCQCCGASRGTGAVIHVDHIKPRSKYPELMLSLDNLQILCADCNLGKSNKDATDWR